jgi:hypothetical protein
MDIKNRNLVKCSITYYYNKDTFYWEEEDDENPPSDEEILERCKEYMLEDVTDLQNPVDICSIEAEFVESLPND